MYRAVLVAAATLVFAATALAAPADIQAVAVAKRGQTHVQAQVLARRELGELMDWNERHGVPARTLYNQGMGERYRQEQEEKKRKEEQEKEEKEEKEAAHKQPPAGGKQPAKPPRRNTL